MKPKTLTNEVLRTKRDFKKKACATCNSEKACDEHEFRTGSTQYVRVNGLYSCDFWEPIRGVEECL